MYSLLQRFFQNFFHSGQPALNGAADAAPANALGCRDLGLAHAENAGTHAGPARAATSGGRKVSFKFRLVKKSLEKGEFNSVKLDSTTASAYNSIYRPISIEQHLYY